MHCIGQSFQLGDLYNRYEEKIIPTTSKYQLSECCEKDLINETDSVFHEITDDGYQRRLHAMGIPIALGNSIMSGLVQPKGASKYIDDTPVNSKKVKVALHYKCITHKKSLPPKHRAYRDHIDHKATHIVSSITYGLECFLVVEQDVALQESVEEAKKALMNAIHAQDYSNQRHTFYGDFNLPNTVTSIKGIQAFCSNLKQMVDDNMVIPLPIEVLLHPLDASENKYISNTIDETICDKLATLNYSYHKAMAQCQDMIKQASKVRIRNCDTAVEKVVNIYSKFHGQFIEHLSKRLSCARKSGNDEYCVIKNIFKSYQLFNDYLSKWIEQLHEEFSIVETIEGMCMHLCACM